MECSRVNVCIYARVKAKLEHNVNDIKMSSIMSSSSIDETQTKDEEKALLLEEPHNPTIPDVAPLNSKLWLSIAVNTIATVGIVRILSGSSKWH